ncbi:MAG: excinuclease ABC subunit UvrC [Candidatus Aureabacteria bacterium]|nr:excinuclease ABC subunit UvrC [Candidatus Auribacterota bacterium]
MNKRLKSIISGFPSCPGIYRMRDASGRIIYIGKAAVLRKRVGSYFAASPRLDDKTLSLVREVRAVDYMVTGSEAEALILESKLIKQYMPRYNMLLKDDKSYPYIKIGVNDRLPGVEIVREKVKDSNLYFGPFTDVKLLRKTVKYLKGRFRLRGCNYAQPGAREFRHCLYRKIGVCDAPCVGRVTCEEYNKRVKNLCMVLRGKRTQLQKIMYSEMKSASAALDYEKAAYIRDCINAVKDIMGPSVKRHERGFCFSFPEEEKEGLKKILQIDRDINVIEAFDASFSLGPRAVGSMVRFVGGRPDKNSYRRFIISDINSRDDFSMIKEMVFRRYKRLSEERGELPDLVMVDGGGIQLDYAVKSLDSLRLGRIPVMALAKKFEEIYLPHRRLPLRIPKDSPVLKFLQRIRDEAHRFAISHQRKISGKTMFSSLLRRVRGVGPVRQRKLLSSFHTLNGILRADAADIARKLSIGAEAAEKIQREIKNLKFGS